MTLKTSKKIKKISDVIDKGFHETWRDFEDNKYIRFIEKGGRSSAKSSNIAKMLILTLLKHPINIGVFRKTGGETLKRSVYEQLKWAITQLGVDEYFIIKKFPPELIYKERGNKITFAGVDDPEKLKGLNSAEFPYAVFWFEEITEFKSKDEIETVIKSIVRGKLPKTVKGEKLNLKYKGFFSYNPPRNKFNWVNQEFEIKKDDPTRKIHHTTYLDNPHLAEEFYIEADIMKRNDEIGYKHIYLGEPVGHGVVPFPKLIVDKIKKSDLASLTVFRNGIDWGYGTDPFAFVRWGYDRKKKRIYAVDEIYGVQLDDDDIMPRVKRLVHRNDEVICDNSEPKTIARYKKHGIRTVKAKKGAGSVEAGERWLSQLEIYIDPARTPNIAREFQMIDYATDREGNVIPRLQDKNNHTIDATRYAFEDDQKERRKIEGKKLLRPKGI